MRRIVDESNGNAPSSPPPGAVSKDEVIDQLLHRIANMSMELALKDALLAQLQAKEGQHYQAEATEVIPAEAS